MEAAIQAGSGGEDVVIVDAVRAGVAMLEGLVVAHRRMKQEGRSSVDASL